MLRDVTTAGARSPLASSRARRTRTLARWVRYSTLAFRSAWGSAPSAARSAAEAASAPSANAASTPAARSGVDPMFTRPTPVAPFARTPPRRSPSPGPAG